MKYEINFYLGTYPNDVRALGTLKLADINTYQHYLNLLNSDQPFNIWFNHYDNEYIHRNARLIKDNSYTFHEVNTTDPPTKSIAILLSDVNKVTFLTDSEFKNQGRIAELFKQIMSQPSLVITY